MMATSGSVNHTRNRDQIVTDAYHLLNVYGSGFTVSAEDMSFGVTMLNNMVKAWQGKGIHLWAMQEGVLFVTKNTGTYTLDSTGARAANWDDTVITTLTAIGAANDTTLTVATTTGMVAADSIGVVLDDGTIHWTTIVSVDSSTALTITAGLASAAASTSNVYTYTSKINKPLKIHSMRRTTGVETTTSSGNMSEVLLNELAQSEFMALPQKDSNGASSSFYFNPGLSSTKLYLWPRPSAVTYYFRFTYTRMLEDFDTATDNPDFPTEWLEALTWQLALRLATAFGKSQLAMTLLAPMAGAMLEDMLSYDNETAGFSISPDVGY